MTKQESFIFLDSGAFSASTQGVEISVHDYMRFIEEHNHLLTAYCNLDVIGDAEATWRNQRIMERKGFTPLPVFHYEEYTSGQLHYLDRCLEYDYFCLGGMAKGFTVDQRWSFLDTCWEIIKKTRKRVKVHGFGMTVPELIYRYPWYSVDSTSWVLYGRYGIVCVPVTDFKGRFRYDIPPWTVFVSRRSPSNKDIDGKHIDALTTLERRVLDDYLTQRGLVLGLSDVFYTPVGYKLKENEQWAGKEYEGCDPFEDSSTYCDKPLKKTRRAERMIQPGISNNHHLRDLANLLYYLDLERAAECILYLAGNFPAMKNPEVERGFKEVIHKYGRNYNRLISFFFEPDIQTVLDIKRKT